MTSTQLADRLAVKGLGRLRTVQRYRTGERIPDRATIRRIEEITEGKVTWTDWPDSPVRMGVQQVEAA